MDSNDRPSDDTDGSFCAANAARRLHALESLAIVDTAPEQDFDDVTKLVAHICQTPVALISFVETERQFFKSHFGFGGSETPISQSICRYAIQQDDVFEICDTRLDARTQQNPLVDGDPHIRFYAGAPLKMDDGTAIGTLCVLDVEPRQLTSSQAEVLKLLARHVMSILRVRRENALQQEMIERLRTAEADLKSANAAKDRFLAFLSHELRTPLTPVLLTASTMAADARLPEDVRADAQMIGRNIDLQTRLVDDLLDVTRLASGKLELRPESLDLDDLVRQSVEICAADARQKRVAIETRLVCNPPSLNGDRARLKQALVNLIKNAIKFTPEGGSITLETAMEDATAGAPRVSVSVIDTGMGIEASVLPGIFDAYDQGPLSTTRQFGGLGLGLAIARGMVAAHGGTIRAHSDGPGRGATFTITLPAIERPASTDSQRATTAAARPPEQQPCSVNILLVDDHEDTLRAMSRLLKRLKHNVVTATSVQSALDAANDQKFDMVISDVGLPDGTGMDLMRALLGRYPIRGIAVTGYGMEADVQDTRRAGFSTHLTKPIDVDDLEAAIDRLAG